MTELNYVLNC